MRVSRGLVLAARRAQPAWLLVQHQQRHRNRDAALAVFLSVCGVFIDGRGIVGDGRCLNLVRDLLRSSQGSVFRGCRYWRSLRRDRGACGLRWGRLWRCPAFNRRRAFTRRGYGARAIAGSGPRLPLQNMLRRSNLLHALWRAAAWLYGLLIGRAKSSKRQNERRIPYASHCDPMRAAHSVSTTCVSVPKPSMVCVSVPSVRLVVVTCSGSTSPYRRASFSSIAAYCAGN